MTGGEPAAAPFAREEVEGSIPARFERVVAGGPGRPAAAGDRTLSYGALNEAANRVARAIVARRGPASEPVGVLVEHDVPALASILGVLKAGKIYLVLDAQHPVARLRAIAADSGAPLIVTGARHLELAGAVAAGERELLDADAVDPTADGSDLALPLDGHSLAFLGYTSGSTGEPKGVLWDHRGILHRVLCHVNRFGIGPGDRLSVMHRLGTAASFRHTWGALLSGATACLYDMQAQGVDGLGRWLAEARVTHCHLAASVFRHVAGGLSPGANLPDLRLLWVGNEPVFRRDAELYRGRFAPGCRFVNGYALSEAGTVREFVMDAATPLDGDLLPIGHELPDKEVLLLDDEGRPAPPGAPGEIAIRSEYLARGYWRRPELEREMFLPDPAGSGARVYRSGDLGRMGPDGCLVHLGRKGALPKLRGHLVDPLDVERRLLEHPRLAGAAATVREDRPGDQRLVAYVVATAEGAPTASELRAFAEDRLPEHLVPSVWVVLPALPRAGTGKLDRASLPAPGSQRPRLATALVPPRTPIELSLARIWAEALGLDEVGVLDDFLELGGHSLLAAAVVSRVRTAFGVDIPSAALFKAPHVSAMAVALLEHLVRALAPEALERFLVELERGVPPGTAQPAAAAEAPGRAAQ